ncbi:hypothetical protein IGS68_30180 (plasmid) [Skermanella sp. TT6]|uniref:Uncharacterized protein n=1 Tax=Skermanella cutis TaxID=2775420 RepID=A0ABX7BJS9_9PROT|nr:hypothetical protein [Skermanella sp. TT6]QQP92732.1 hypothetical protein IGS68_30180 [Skermanella sp. TT6]
MPCSLTRTQRWILADCTRVALTGWLLTDPAVERKARRLASTATTLFGLQFGRFVDLAMAEFGAGYQPGSILPGVRFPLSIEEAAALANDIELELATDDQLHAAGLIAAHSPFGQPEVCSRDWRTYVAMLAALGLSIDDETRGWRDLVRERLRSFRHAVSGPDAAD